MGIALEQDKSVDLGEKIVGQTGRLAYINDIYKALVDNGFKDRALEMYKENEDFYSPIARNAVKSILGMDGDIRLTQSQRRYKRIRY